MPRAFATIAFTDAVKSAQTRHGSREANHAFELDEDSRSKLTPNEIDFIATRDSIYLATVSSSGWPYVQHRGGPVGFLRVLDSNHIGFADFRGNAQYVSVGNLSVDDRVSLILMDYPGRRRLKIWGRARIVHPHEEPELVAYLEDPDYRACVERGYVIQVEAWDWNCPQHINPRFTRSEIDSLLKPLREENEQLKRRLDNSGSDTANSFGDGPIALIVSGIRRLTKSIRVLEFRAIDGGLLPSFSAGAHLALPVKLTDSRQDLRHYSLCSGPEQRDVYEIAVQLDDNTRGGSLFIHQQYHLGMIVRVSEPINHFSLHADNRPALLIAGGIGVTPLKSMARTLKARGTSFSLHLSVRDRADLFLVDDLKRELPDNVFCHVSGSGDRLDAASLLRNLANDTQIYVCGSGHFISGIQEEAERACIDKNQIHVERFSLPKSTGGKRTFLTLQRQGVTIEVPPDASLLDAVQAAGVPAAYSCRVGNCGACAVQVLQGEPEHRDTVLTDGERSEGKICLCVSRSVSEQMTVDL